MNGIDLIAGLVGAVIIGLIVGYVLYRFKMILHKKSVISNIPGKLEKQNNSTLNISGVRVEPNKIYIVDGKKVEPGKEAKIQEKETELKKIQERLKQVSQSENKKPVKKAKKKTDTKKKK